MSKAVIKDYLRSENVRDRRLSMIQRLSRVGDCPGSKTVHCRRLYMVGDCPRALYEAVIEGCRKDLIYKKNKKPFVLDKGSLGETPMTSFHIWHMHV